MPIFVAESAGRDLALHTGVGGCDGPSVEAQTIWWNEKLI
jgi:hypothetical protein